MTRRCLVRGSVIAQPLVTERVVFLQGRSSCQRFSAWWRAARRSSPEVLAQLAVPPRTALSVLTRLTPSEHHRYSELVTDGLGERVRLEQERIDWAWVEQRLSDAIAGCSCTDLHL
ncbi:Wadjet anti-phage system protein JetD domain-containing protein [Mycolicibacter icosiumassiliensis]|uniref:Wadjet anti-phage system protein JetD domain-containing protein n=1 Tax=Mycolicibacter icosiumassiliensis TaxID=1792835 RepID=UPI00389B332B